jgi:hypothetical protein
MAIAVSCAACGKQYKVSSDNAGKKMRCKCGATMRVPVPKKRSVPKVAAPPDDDSLFSFESKPGEGLVESYAVSGSGERPAGARRKGGFPIFRCVVLPLLVLLLLASVGFVAAVVYEVPAAVTLADKLHLHPHDWPGAVLAQAEIDDDVRYFPDHTQVVAVANVKDLLGSQAFQQLESEAKKLGLEPDDWRKLGPDLTLDDVQRISLGRDDGKSVVAVVRFNRAITAEEIQSAPMLTNLLFGLELVAEGKTFSWSRSEPLEFEKTELGKEKRVVYDSNKFSFALIGDRGVAFGPKESLHHVLQRKGRNHLSRRLQEELARAEPGESAFVWAMTAAAIPAHYREDLENQLGGDYVKKVEAMSISLHASSEIAVNAALLCRDDASAEAIGKEAGQWLNLFKRLPIKGLPKDLYNTTSITTGRRYSASISTDADKIIKGTQTITGFVLKSVMEGNAPKEEKKDKE